MASGYTGGVKNGDITEFSDFAMLCARALAPLIDMRDYPLDAKVPAKIKPRTSYYDERIKFYQERITALANMSKEEAQRSADLAYIERMASYQRFLAEKRLEKDRYEAMLVKVSGWRPPTPEHYGLKKFMLDQLHESIKFDCGGAVGGPEPQKETGAKWRSSEIDESMRMLAYYQKERGKEVDRAQTNTKWLDELRGSL